MALPNRVDPFGELFATSARGTLLGNRGGRIHNEQRSLGARRWASRQWICCELSFKDRHRDVWSSGYTELLFLDEVTGLAAGHRPCFECRREDAEDFAAAWARAQGLAAPPRAPEMDKALHAERLNGRAKRVHRLPIDELPDGAVIALDDGAWAIRGDEILRWTPNGYDARRARPRGLAFDVLTPPVTLAVLAAGYQPRWHGSIIDRSDQQS